jgi:sulfonate transport system substrate-binding protein
VKTAAWVSDEKNRAAVLESWALSAEHRNILERNYASYTLKERISPLLDDSFLTGLRRDSWDAKRFGLVKQDAEADWHGDAWIDPNYLRQALRELGLEDFWPQGDPGGDVRNDP